MGNWRITRSSRLRQHVIKNKIIIQIIHKILTIKIITRQSTQRIKNKIQQRRNREPNKLQPKNRIINQQTFRKHSLTQDKTR